MVQKTTSPLVRRQIAGKLAALSVLSNCDSLAIPDKDSLLSDFVDCALASDDNRDTLETLQTALFRADSRGGFSFWHPALADFLAAEYVDKALGDGFHLNRLLPLVATPQGIPTRVRPLCAWLASISAEARYRIRALDPLVLLSGDVDQLSVREKEELIRALARRYGEREWQREITAFGELARGCDPALVRRMLAKRNSLAVRGMALDLIEQGRVEELYPDVWTVTADAAESAGLRLEAVRLLLQRGMPAYARELRTLLSRDVDDGWNDEVAGSILMELYPAHLTTEDALVALRWPQEPNHFGRFHMFWAVEFQDRTVVRDLQSGLARLHALLLGADGRRIKDEAHWLPRLFSRLLTRYIEGLAEIEPVVAGPWLDVNSETRLLTYYHFDREAVDRIVIWLQRNPGAKRSLLRWKLDQLGTSQSFSLWHFPFLARSLTSEDFDWVAAEFRDEDRSAPRLGLFQILMQVYQANDCLPYERFDVLSELAESDEDCRDVWRKSLYVALDNDDVAWRLEQAEWKREGDIEKAKYRAYLGASIPQIRSGRIPPLDYVCHELLQHNSEWFVIPNLASLVEAHGRELADATAEGLLAVWAHPPYNVSEWDRNDHQVPCWLIAAGFGLELSWNQQGTDWARCTPEQAGTATLIALRHSNGLPPWFDPLYQHHAALIEDRVTFCLLKEAFAGAPNSHPKVISNLAHAQAIPTRLVEVVLGWLYGQPFPTHPQAAEYLLRIGLANRSPMLAAYARRAAEKIWLSRVRKKPEALYRNLLPVAAWWFMDWQPAMQLLEQWVFVGNQRRVRIETFVEAIRGIAGSDPTFGWPQYVEQAACIALLPWLYLAHPPHRDRPKQNGRVMRAVQLCDQRDAMLKHIAAGPIDPALSALRTWRPSPRFKGHRSWLEQMIHELERKSIDQSWAPPTPQEVAKVLFRNHSLVRSDKDLHDFLVDGLSNDVRDLLAEDTSLVPRFLWEGKKGSRTPSEEKCLQDLLRDKIKTFIGTRKRNVVGSREPELHDEKKPDYYVSAALEGGITVSVPIEIKQAHAGDLWTAPKKQLVEKYMKPQGTRYGIYLVGWYGCKHVTRLPKSRNDYGPPEALQSALQRHVDAELDGTGKTVTVVVLDVCVNNP